MVLKAMEGYSAAQSGDRVRCATGAAEVEAFGARRRHLDGLRRGGVPVGLRRDGSTAPARSSHTFHGSVLDDLPRDVNWLLTLQCVLEAALAVDDREVVENAARLLAPYDGRAVINAGAVMFHGVTDDTLARAAGQLGDPETAARLRARALATYERIGAQWWRDRLASWADRRRAVGVSRRPACTCTRHRAASGSSGRTAPPPRCAALRGFGYLRELLRRPGQPVAALDLVGAGTGVVDRVRTRRAADQQALAAYRERLRDLDASSPRPRTGPTTDDSAAARAERDALLGELARATGLNGRARTTGSSQERARIAVQKAITAALERIESVDTGLGATPARAASTPV